MNKPYPASPPAAAITHKMQLPTGSKARTESRNGGDERGDEKRSARVRGDAQEELGWEDNGRMRPCPVKPGGRAPTTPAHSVRSRPLRRRCSAPPWTNRRRSWLYGANCGRRRRRGEVQTTPERWGPKRSPPLARETGTQDAQPAPVS